MVGDRCAWPLDDVHTGLQSELCTDGLGLSRFQASRVFWGQQHLPPDNLGGQLESSINSKTQGSTLSKAVITDAG